MQTTLVEIGPHYEGHITFHSILQVSGPDLTRQEPPVRSVWSQPMHIAPILLRGTATDDASQRDTGFGQILKVSSCYSRQVVSPS